MGPVYRNQKPESVACEVSGEEKVLYFVYGLVFVFPGFPGNGWL